MTCLRKEQNPNEADNLNDNEDEDETDPELSADLKLLHVG